MATFQTLPRLWLLSDERNDSRLEDALARLPSGSGFVFRHYHLEGDGRRRRFEQLGALARSRGHLAVLSDNPEAANEWGADGVYGDPRRLGRSDGLFRFATAHDDRDIALASSAEADAVFLSPVFPTRSHPDGGCLGPLRFRAIAARSDVPVIALGGMTAERARELDWPRWGAIDGLCDGLDSTNLA